MQKIGIFMVAYDRLYDKSFEKLSQNEISCLRCYAVRKSVPKKITDKVQLINEWELNWNDYSYQQKQYYEYGSMVHLLMNPDLIDGLTHIGILHYDIYFNADSILNIEKSISQNSDLIFYQSIRGINDLYLTAKHLVGICEFMSNKLDMNIDVKNILINGWISEALSVVPREVFLKFAKFLMDNKQEIEDILISNRWGIMDNINHRICGIVERMWGFYLVSLNMPLVQMDIQHDWNSYEHQHQNESNWIK